MSRMVRLTIFCLLLVGCGADAVDQPMTWRDVSLHGRTLELVDKRFLQQFRFNENGIAVSTVGEKGGPIAAPIFYWRIENDYLVISQSPNTDVVIELRSLSKRGNVIVVVTKSGERREYKLT